MGWSPGVECEWSRVFASPGTGTMELDSSSEELLAQLLLMLKNSVNRWERVLSLLHAVES